MLKWILLSLATLTVIGVSAIAAAPVIIRKATVHAFAATPWPSIGRGLMLKLAVANAVRPYVLPPDTTITPEAAGRAYHYLVQWPDSRRGPALQPAPDSAANAWYHAEGTDSLGPLPPAQWCGDVMRRAARGLTTEEVRLLSAATNQPRDTLFRTFARAPHADILGTRWTFEGRSDEALFFLKLPVPNVSPFVSAVRVWCGRAALQLHDGKITEAEQTLREALSASLLLTDEAPTVVELLAGAVLAKSVALDLATFYDATGHTSDAAAIRAAIARAKPAPLPGALGGPDPRFRDVVDALPAAASRPDVAQALKWEWFAVAQSVKVRQYCVGDDELGSDYAAWRNSLRPALVRRPSDGRYFDWITTKPTRDDTACDGSATGDRD
ncbi:MAG TPA: hypothetical protein VFT57_20060 [Gemmatimonadaceae bacterium]|nr:hypothetical protein [Gemmatimonadaceae bacterium]